MELKPQAAQNEGDIFAQTAEVLLERFKDAYKIGPETIVKTSSIEAYDGTGFMNDFVVELPQKAPRLLFVFRIFNRWLAEYSEFLRLKPIPMKEEYVEFFANEWSELDIKMKQMNPFCEDSHKFRTEVNGIKVWVSLNFDYSACEESLKSQKSAALIPIRDLFKDPNSKGLKNIEKAGEIFKAVAEETPSSSYFGSWILSSAKNLIDYPIEGAYEKFLEAEKDLKISLLADLCHGTSDDRRIIGSVFNCSKSDFLLQPYEGLTTGETTEFADTNATVGDIFTVAVANKGIRDCSQGFGQSQCPYWSWTDSSLSFFKRTIQITEDVFVAISGNHVSQGLGLSSEDIEILKENNYPHFVVRISSKTYGYGPNGMYHEFNMLVIKNKARK